MMCCQGIKQVSRQAEQCLPVIDAALAGAIQAHPCLHDAVVCRRARPSIYQRTSKQCCRPHPSAHRQPGLSTRQVFAAPTTLSKHTCRRSVPYHNHMHFGCQAWTRHQSCCQTPRWTLPPAARCTFYESLFLRCCAELMASSTRENAVHMSSVWPEARCVWSLASFLLVPRAKSRVLGAVCVKLV